MLHCVHQNSPNLRPYVNRQDSVNYSSTGTVSASLHTDAQITCRAVRDNLLKCYNKTKEIHHQYPCALRRESTAFKRRSVFGRFCASRLAPDSETYNNNNNNNNKDMCNALNSHKPQMRSQ